MKNKVVIVDDNANNLMLEKDLLEISGFEVFEAKNGADGIALVSKIKPDIILMDVRLPDMLGTEAIKLLRKDKKLCGIPVVFVTASVMANVREEIRGIPNSRFMGKPINTRTFSQEISEFMNGVKK